MKQDSPGSVNTMKRNIFWAVIYVLLISLVAFILFFTADRIKTHTIPVGDIELSVPYSKYLQSETVAFSIKNSFTGTIYVINNCPNEPLAVYQLNGTKWTRIHDQASEEACPLEQRKVGIAAGDTMSGNFAAWPNLFKEPGKYRIVAYVENYNSLPYQDIEIIEKKTAEVKKEPTVMQPIVTSTLPTSTINNTENINENQQEVQTDN